MPDTPAPTRGQGAVQQVVLTKRSERLPTPMNMDHATWQICATEESF